ncbi:MAG: amine oxidase, partial [Burkholderiaceae bacterium]
GLGYVVSTHQDIRVSPPQKTVFSAYMALSDRTPDAARKWLDRASPEELLAAASVDLKTAYGWKLAPCVERVDITLRGHAMAAPTPGFRSNAGLKALRELDGPILFAHADLSGFSVFEEAAWWGYRAAKLALA